MVRRYRGVDDVNMTSSSSKGEGILRYFTERRGTAARNRGDEPVLSFFDATMAIISQAKFRPSIPGSVFEYNFSDETIS